MELAAPSGLDKMNSAETNPKKNGDSVSRVRENRLHGLTRGRAARRATVSRLSLLYNSVWFSVNSVKWSVFYSRKVGRKKVQEAQKQRAEESARQAVCHLTPCGTKLAVLVCVHELNLDH